MAEASLTDLREVDPNFLDGILALQVMLSQEYPVSIYQRQILMSRRSADDAIMFAHGVPDTTVLTSAVTAQNKRMRRALMERKGVPVPRGANFSMGRGIPLAKKFAKDMGFPVVVKPSKGDTGFLNFPNVKNLRELSTAITQLKAPVHERENIFRSGYTPMELGVPMVENGRQIVSRGYRFLVEQRVSGALIRFVVYNGEVISAVECDGTPLDGSLRATKDILESVHPELIDAVLQAGQALAGLPLVALDVVVADPTRSLRRQKYWVVDLYERPFFWVQAKAESVDVLQLMERVVREYCEAKEFGFSPVQPEVSVSYEIRSLPSADEGAEELARMAAELGLECEVEQISVLDGSVAGVLHGSSFEIARLLNDITNNQEPTLPAMMVEVQKMSDVGRSESI